MSKNKTENEKTLKFLEELEHDLLLTLHNVQKTQALIKGQISIAKSREQVRAN
jgi:hypothetical protein